MIHIRRLTAQGFKQLQQVELVFPRHGRFLIQGMNEAGKSTLFEAVYFGLFGRALSTETAQQRLDDVIRYGQDAAWVALELDLPAERWLRITRRVRRGRPNVWELDVVEADGRIEEIRSNTAVNERIEAELRFDGEALLNTCFVEQKKLEKLEGLGRSQREQSLMKLLNLDRMVALEAELKVRPADTAHVERLRDRVELARLRTALPVDSARLAEVTQALARHALHAELVVALAAVEAATVLAERLAAARAHEAALAERVAAAERLRAGLQQLHEAATARDRAREADADAQRLAVALAEAELARDARQPAVVARGLGLNRLKRRLELLHRLTAERAELSGRAQTADAQLAEAARERETLNDVRHALVEARGAARDAETDSEVLAGDVRAFDVRDALKDWLAAQAPGRPVEESAADLDAARAALAVAMQRTSAELLAIGIAGLGGLGVWRWLAPAVWPLGWWVVLLAVLALGAGRWRAGAARQRALAEAVGRLEGAASVQARDQALQRERQHAAASRLTELNAVRPADGPRAATAVAELDARLGQRTRGQVGAELGSARAAAALATADIKRLEAQEAALRVTASGFDASALGRERDGWVARVTRLDAFLMRRQPGMTALAEALAVAPDLGVIEGELGVLRAEHKALATAAARVPELTAERDARLAVATRHWAGAAAAWASLPPLDGLPAWSADLTDAQWTAASDGLASAYEAAGGDAVRRAADAATRSAAQLAGECASATRALEARLADARRRADELGLGLRWPSVPDGPGLSAIIVIVAGQLGGRADELTLERDALSARVNVTRHEIVRLEQALGLKDEPLDHETEAAAYTAAAHTLAVRERAGDMVARAGRNVVQRVLPSTIEHMRRLLPTLTDGRYFDAELTDDYRIKVLDERAGDWKQKNIFSGGTKDQFSLALRLAFALATLPEERGAAPSFLFLDEPLSAFDDARARALVDLLTSGEIATSFDQIFLISHVRVDEALFDYHITLADGRVAESNLPESAIVAPVAQLVMPTQGEAESA